MKRYLIVLIFNFMIFLPAVCQESKSMEVRILFQGLVMDAVDFSPLSNSQIAINNVFTAVSSDDGTFAFYVYRNDTVVFSNLGYKSTILYISDTLSGKEFIAGVYMQSDTLSIGDVVIIPRLSNLRSDILNAKSKTPETFNNAKYNVAISAYQGRNSISSLGTPEDNYAVISQKQKEDAYSRGGIPSDKIAGISPLLLIPAAYLLINGPPELPAPMKPYFSGYEVDQINKKYLEIKRLRE